MIAAMAKAPLPRFTESAINELFTARNLSSFCHKLVKRSLCDEIRGDRLYGESMDI